MPSLPLQSRKSALCWCRPHEVALPEAQPLTFSFYLGKMRVGCCLYVLFPTVCLSVGLSAFELEPGC